MPCGKSIGQRPPVSPGQDYQRRRRPRKQPAGVSIRVIMSGGFGSEEGQNQAGNTRAGRTRREDGTGDAGRGGGEKQKGEKGYIRHGKCT